MRLLTVSRAGCNRFTGSYELGVAAGQIATTSMACISGMEAEQAFYEVLRNAYNYSLTRDHQAAKEPTGVRVERRGDG